MRARGGKLTHYLLLIRSGEAFAPCTWPEQMEGADEDKSGSLSPGKEEKKEELHIAGEFWC